jgi:hypothetical protein
LMGWEPQEITRHEYDDAGRLVRSVTASEPEFTREQVDLFLAADLVENDIGPHGHPVSETTSPLASGSKRQWHYVADGPFADNATQVEAEARERYAKQYPDKSLAGLFWTVKKVDG